MYREKLVDWFDSTAAMMLLPSEVNAMSEIQIYYMNTCSNLYVCMNTCT